MNIVTCERVKSKGPYLVTVSGRGALYIQDGARRVSTRTSDRGAAHRELQRYIDENTARGSLIGAELSTVSGVLDHWERRRRTKLEKSGTWHKKYRYIVAKLHQRIGQTPLNDITFTFSDWYDRERRADGVGSETIRQELQIVRTAWRMAHADRLTLMPPAAYDLPKTSPGRDDYFTKSEAEAMITAAGSRHVRLFLEIGFRTGARPGSILRLTWDRVDLKARRIDFRPRDADGRALPETKKKFAVAPINERLLRTIELDRGGCTAGPVIRYRGGAVQKIDLGFRRAREGAGIDRHLTPHAMRHSVITWLAQAGRSFYEIAGLVGHSSPAMLEKVYGHHSPGHLRGAASELEF